MQLYFKRPFGILAFISVTHYNSKSPEEKPLKTNETLLKSKGSVFKFTCMNSKVHS